MRYLKILLLISLFLAQIFYYLGAVSFLPKDYSIAKTVDNNEVFFDVNYPSTSAVKVWNVTWGTVNQDNGYGIACDSKNYIYTVGRVGPAPENGTIIKYDQNGNKIWQRFWGKKSVDNEFMAITIDDNDNIYVVGYSNENGAYNATLIKYDTSGNEIWNVSWGGSTNDKGYGVAIDANGDIYITGYTTSYDVSGNRDLFLVKYNSMGIFQWQSIIGTNNTSEYPHYSDVAVDNQGFIYITGKNRSSDGIVLVKFNNNGNMIWNVTYNAAGSGTYETPFGIAIDSNDDIYIVGSENITGSPLWDYDILILKYNSSGSFQWKRLINKGIDDNGRDISIDSKGFLYITGSFLVPPQPHKIHLLKYDNSGNQIWEYTWNLNSNNGAEGVCIDNDDNIFLVATMSSFSVG
ncbi:MAG: SBBP repeat-containing protein, partial [Promethearchaeia archaeon]